MRFGEDIMIWKSFVLQEKRKWFYTNEDSVMEISDKEWFNKTTTDIKIYEGYETKENDIKPISNIIYYILIHYQIANYFGDKSGMHYRSKIYVLVDDKLYQQKNGSSVEVKRLTKELKGILREIKI